MLCQGLVIKLAIPQQHLHMLLSIYPQTLLVKPFGVQASVARVLVAVKMVVVEVDVVVSQYNKNLPSLSDVVGSSAPESSLELRSASSSNELQIKPV